MASDNGLQSLLELDGERFYMETGHWTKFEARLVTPCIEIPHGIRYCLTLHDRKGRRLLGFDNAHALKKTKRFESRRIEWDHRHDADLVTAFDFDTPAALVQEFWAAVDAIIGNTRESP